MIVASLLQDLSQPEYVHVLINPLPVYGLAIGVLALVISLFQRSRTAQVTALLLIVVCGAIAWPVAHYGGEAYDRVLSLSDDQGQDWLKAHAERADRFIGYFYALAAIAVSAVLIPLRWPKAALSLTIISLLCACAVLGMGGYIAYAGGKIRHREFRNEPAPVIPVEQDEH